MIEMLCIKVGTNSPQWIADDKQSDIRRICTSKYTIALQFYRFSVGQKYFTPIESFLTKMIKSD
jgi:hypothetical protein